MKGKLIVGDSREVLRLEENSYLSNAVKVVYIDPPYNTGSDKSYKDKSCASAWRQDMICVLKILKNILAQDGAIFISIDDNEYASLKLLCDGIFGRENFLGTFITRQAQRSNSKFINITHEYILSYAKNKKYLSNFSVRRLEFPEQRQMIEDITGKISASFNGDIKSAETALRRLINYYCERDGISWLKNYNCVDEAGRVYFASDLSMPGKPRSVDIPEIGLRLAPLKSRSWASDAKFVELYGKGLLAFRNGRPYCKKFLVDARDNAPSILNFYSRFGTRDMNRLGLRGLFDTPKPVELIKFLIRLLDLKTGDCVLDCFAGSGTTAQAVVEVNLEDGKDLDFVLVQRRERIKEKSAVYESCLKHGIEPYVSEITRLRIKKVYEKHGIKEELAIMEM